MYRIHLIRRHAQLVAALELLPHFWTCWTK